MFRTSPLRVALGILALLLIAGLAYFWATATIDSLYAFRSPLAENPPAPGPALGGPLTRRVVFVLIDGLRTDTADDAALMPFLAELRARGASAAVHSRPASFSAPSYTVLFTGAWPDVSDGPAVNLDYDEYWTWTQDDVFSSVHAAGGRTAVSGYYWFEKLIPQASVDAHFYTPGDDAAADRAVVDAALPWLQNGDYQLVLIHVEQVDYAGHHEGGPISPNWAAAARRADDLLREIVGAMDLTQDTVLVTSDHGHIDRGGHGGPEPVLLRQPLVLAGAGVQPGVYGDTDQVDTAPTLAALLGANIPASAQGQVRTEMLTLTPAQVEAVTAAETAQKRTLAEAYGAAIDRPIAAQLSSARQAARAMPSAKLNRLNTERLPRLVVALVLLIVLGIALWRVRGPALTWALAGVLAYLVVFNVRYALVDRLTYSLTTVAGANELILYVAVTALLAAIVGWLVFALGMRLFSRPPGEAARLTLGWALLTVAVAGLPALVSFVWNGPVITWTLPEFWTFFVGFLAVLQILFIAVFGILFVGAAAVVARIRKPAAGVA